MDDGEGRKWTDAQYVEYEEMLDRERLRMNEFEAKRKERVRAAEGVTLDLARELEKAQQERVRRSQRFTAVLFLILAANALVALYLSWFSLAAERSATAVSEDPAVRGDQVDRDNVPRVYSGQVVDIDNDGADDVALFGEPNAPIVRPLVNERDNTPIIVAGFVFGATVIGALSSILVSVLGPWAQSRWPKKSKDETVATPPVEQPQPEHRESVALSHASEPNRQA